MLFGRIVSERPIEQVRVGDVALSPDALGPSRLYFPPGSCLAAGPDTLFETCFDLDAQVADAVGVRTEAVAVEYVSEGLTLSGSLRAAPVDPGVEAESVTIPDGPSAQEVEILFNPAPTAFWLLFERLLAQTHDPAARSRLADLTILSVLWYGVTNRRLQFIGSMMQRMPDVAPYVHDLAALATRPLSTRDPWAEVDTGLPFERPANVDDVSSWTLGAFSGWTVGPTTRTDIVVDLGPTRPGRSLYVIAADRRYWRMFGDALARRVRATLPEGFDLALGVCSLADEEPLSLSELVSPDLQGDVRVSIHTVAMPAFTERNRAGAFTLARYFLADALMEASATEGVIVTDFDAYPGDTFAQRFAELQSTSPDVHSIWLARWGRPWLAATAPYVFAAGTNDGRAFMSDMVQAIRTELETNGEPILWGLDQSAIAFAAIRAIRRGANVRNGVGVAGALLQAQHFGTKEDFARHLLD